MKRFIFTTILIAILLTFPFTASTLHAGREGVQEDVLQYAPTLCFDYKERYFPVDVHGDDYNVINNHENYEKGLFPDRPVCYYNVVSYDDFKVYEYWFYYAYNEYDYYSIKINDVHEHDFESVFVWVDERGSPFFVATSMHLWVQGNQYNKGSHPFVYVERGGHGMSLNKRLVDGVPMVFEKPGRLLKWKDFTFKDFSDLISHSHEDLDKGYYRTDEVAKIRVKAPWLRRVFRDPDVIRRFILGQQKLCRIIRELLTLLSSFSIPRYPHRGLHTALPLTVPQQIVWSGSGSLLSSSPP